MQPGAPSLATGSADARGGKNAVGEIIETTWALVRGYGIQLVPVQLELTQLKELYKEHWEDFIGMAGVVAAFGPNDLTTAELPLTPYPHIRDWCTRVSSLPAWRDTVPAAAAA